MEDIFDITGEDDLSMGITKKQAILSNNINQSIWSARRTVIDVVAAFARLTSFQLDSLTTRVDTTNIDTRYVYIYLENSHITPEQFDNALISMGWQCGIGQSMIKLKEANSNLVTLNLCYLDEEELKNNTNYFYISPDSGIMIMQTNNNVYRMHATGVVLYDGCHMHDTNILTELSSNTDALSAFRTANLSVRTIDTLRIFHPLQDEQGRWYFTMHWSEMYMRYSILEPIFHHIMNSSSWKNNISSDVLDDIGLNNVYPSNIYFFKKAGCVAYWYNDFDNQCMRFVLKKL